MAMTLHPKKQPRIAPGWDKLNIHNPTESPLLLLTQHLPVHTVKDFFQLCFFSLNPNIPSFSLPAFRKSPPNSVFSHQICTMKGFHQHCLGWCCPRTFPKMRLLLGPASRCSFEWIPKSRALMWVLMNSVL